MLVTNRFAYQLIEIKIEIEIEIVYNNTSINRLLSVGPPVQRQLFVDLYAGADREPLIPTSPLAVTIPSKTYPYPCIYHFLIYT
jgi:hypothetical protein